MRISVFWSKNRFFQAHKLNEIPPVVTERCMCTFRLRSRPKVWMAMKIAGVTPFESAILCTERAARIPILLSKKRFHQKKSHSSEGMVKVICCQVVLGRIPFCFLIQSSVAFFPQDEQAFDLQEWGIRFTWVHLGLEQWYSWWPRIICRQLKSLAIAIIMAGRRRCACLVKKQYQFLFESKICFIE